MYLIFFPVKLYFQYVSSLFDSGLTSLSFPGAVFAGFHEFLIAGILSNGVCFRRSPQQLACLLIEIEIALPPAMVLSDFVSGVFPWLAGFQSVCTGREPYCIWW